VWVLGEMCVTDDSCVYRTEDSSVTDELDNQVITKGDNTTDISDNRIIEQVLDNNIEAVEKRRQIGDEFYREAEDIEADPQQQRQSVVQVTGRVIAVETGGGQCEENFSVPVVTSVDTGVPALELKLEEAKILSDTQDSSNSPPSSSPPPPHPVISGPTTIPITVLPVSVPENVLAVSTVSDIFQEQLSGQQEPEEPMVVSYNGSVSDYHGGQSVQVTEVTSHMMTATTETVLDSVLVSGLIKNEPEDLTGQRHRHGSDITLDVGVTAKRLLVDSLDKSGMGLVTSPDGDSHIILNTEDLPLAPGFSPVTTGYDPPSFYTSSSPVEGGPGRMYGGGDSYRDQEIYPGDAGYRSQNTGYSLYSGNTGLSVDLPSPDSGIGPDQITPKGFVDSDSSFDYTQNILNDNTIPRKPWHDYGSRNSDSEKIQIPKVYTPYGFRYNLDAPTSSAVRREDDKVTYINKGQFYGVTLEYHPDPEHGHGLKSATVKSVIMLVFRDGKSTDEEIKAWQFWHQRQHSVKQRIIDVDTKNSLGLIGHIEELSHNALAVYWNPLESPAKVNLAVQCLSTDFSTQKGVKGLPLHVQIDTYDDPRSEVGSTPSHRGYSQVKIFCDKGAERKLRDEERRAAKRRMTPSGKRRLDEMYHESFERTEFYAMSDLTKSPTLFTPPEDPERASQLSTDFPGFYSQSPQRSSEGSRQMSNGDILPGLMSGAVICIENKQETAYDERAAIETKQEPGYLEKSAKRPRLIPPVTERIMVYVRQETEDVYTPLHLVPPTVTGLISAIENKYKINATNIRYLYRKNKDGIVAKIDDDMLRHYCNEDVFLMQVMVTEGPGGEETSVYDITLSEIHATM